MRRGVSVPPASAWTVLVRVLPARHNGVREVPPLHALPQQGRRLGLRRGADWGCAGAQTGAAQGRRLGLRRGADWGCAGAQIGAAQGRRLGLRRGADWGCA